MKKILLTFLASFCLQAYAQTFQVNKLQGLDTTNATSPTTGAATFSGGVGILGDVWTGAAYHGNGLLTNLTVSNSTTLNGTVNLNGVTSFGGTVNFPVPPTVNTSSTLYPTVPTNAALQAFSTATSPFVWRLGFFASGDVAPLLYQGTAGSGAGGACGSPDNGDQVPSADGKCWIAKFPYTGFVDAAQYGIKADSTTDNTAALQAAWTYAGSINASLLLPKSSPTGMIKFSSLSAPSGSQDGGGSQAGGPLSNLVGRGYGQTWLFSTAIGTACALTFNASGNLWSNSDMGRVAKGFNLYSPNVTGSANGICLNQISGMEISDVELTGFATGISATDVIRLRVENSVFQSNGTGIFGTKGSFSNPNAWTLINNTFGSNTHYAILLNNASDINLYGGDFEGNNPSNTGGFSTILMNGNPIDGRKGLAVFGGYYQGNGGDSEFTFVQNSGEPGAIHSLHGVEIGRTSGTTFTTNIIRNVANGVTANVVSVFGISVWRSAAYTPSAARPYLGTSGGGSISFSGDANSWFQAGVDCNVTVCR